MTTESNNSYNIFKKGSKTYFISSLLFPKQIRNKVTTLYAFVRTADDYVDNIPQKKREFYKFWDMYTKKDISNDVIKSFVALEKNEPFEKKWTKSFLKSMEADLYKKKYITLQELEKYMYGSAEVIGLCMAKILKLPPQSLPYAKLLGKSMQFVNFIRDIDEDIYLGRQYLPQEDLEKFKLKSLNESETIKKKDNFILFINYELDRYFAWQKEAEKGFSYLPKNIRVPIKTASDVYKWTANEIKKNPYIVYKRKVKPTRYKVLLKASQNLLFG